MQTVATTSRKRAENKRRPRALRAAALVFVISTRIVDAQATRIAGTAPQSASSASRFVFCKQPLRMTLNAASHDEEVRTGEPPADVSLTSFPTADGRAPLRVFSPQGRGPHPVLVLFHGFPGTELNFDLAHAARRAGWAVLIPHYRGSWGAPGAYSWHNVLDDAATVVRWARTPEAQMSHHLDPRLIVVAGHSLGGFAALWIAGHDTTIAAAASLAGFNFGAHANDASKRASSVENALSTTASDWQSSTEFLRETSGRALASEAFAAGESWNLVNLVGTLARRPVLLVAGTGDGVANPAVHHRPLVHAFRAAGASRLTTLELPGDHGFVDHRIGLADRLVSWLREVQRGACSQLPPQ